MISSDSLMFGYGSFAVVIGLLLLRIPIGVALGSVAILGTAYVLNFNVALSLLQTVPFPLFGDWTLSAIPMFVLMGFLCTETGLTSGVFAAARKTFAGIPGNLGIATIAACTIFSASSGSSVATAAAMSQVAVPQMLRYGYNPGLATGIVAAAGTLGALIPPSILMLVYAVFAGVSVSQLFAAGFLPGLLSATIFATVVMIRVIGNPANAPSDGVRVGFLERISALWDVTPLLSLIAFVMGGIFFGWFTPTEAGALGVVFTILLSLKKQMLSKQAFITASRKAAESTASIFIIAAGASLYSKFLGLTGVPDALSATLLSITDSPVGILLMIAVVYLILGAFIDSMGILLLTAPVVLPIVQAVDINLIWFGIIVVKLLEIGLVTPPVGLNVFVIKSALGDRVPLGKIFAGTAWFIIGDLVTLGLLIAFPAISLYLPSLMQ